MKNNNQQDNTNSKVTVDSLCKQIKVMRPGNAMSFIAKQLGMGSTEFILKNVHKIAGLAIKNGWIKTKDIGSAIAKFGEKNKEDNTGIDFSKLKIDPSTTQFKCLFDGDAGKQIQKFMSTFEAEIKDEGKEIEKADAQLHKDVKSAGVDMDEQEIDDNGLAVASVIDNKKNKGVSGKKLKKKIEAAIEKDKKAKEIQKVSKELTKTSSKVKVDKKYENLSDEELAKLDDKINKKIKQKSESSKKNDAFRNTIKNAVQKGVAEDFKKSVKTAYVSTNALKKTIAKNMKSGLAVEQIKEPRAICISVQCSKKDFGNILKESDNSANVIDVTNGAKDKSIQKVIDYIKKALQDKIGKDKLGEKIYAYLKNSSGNCLLYVFAGVKQDKLDESILNEEALSDDVIKKAILAGGEKLANAGKNSREMAAALKSFIPKDEDEAMKLAAQLAKGGANELAAQDAVRELCKGQDWYSKLDSDDIQELKDKLSTATNDPDETFKFLSNASDTAKDAADSATDAAKDVASSAASSVDDVATNVVNSDIKDANTAADIASTTADTASDAMNSIPSFNYGDINNEIKELNSIFSDGKIDADEMQKLAQVGDKLKLFSKWAAEHQNIDDPSVRERIAQIKALCSHYHGMLEDNKDVLDGAAAAASDARTGATEATKAASKEMANDEEVKKVAGGWKEKLGLDKAFTALGWARLAAKSTGIILNNGKAVVDALGATAMKFKEDSNVIAQMNFILSNSDDSDSKFNDTKFSVRFSTNDFKWHATCLDDRKMKFPEDVVIKKALDSAEGKKFKKVCLQIFSSIFNPNDKIGKIIPFIMRKYEQLGIKPDKGDASKMIKTIEKIEGNFDKIKEAFK